MTALHTLLGQGVGSQVNDLKLMNIPQIKYTDEFAQIWFKSGYTEIDDGTTYPKASRTLSTIPAGATSTLFTASQITGNPLGIKFDSGNYYVMDSTDYTIKVYNSSFVYQTSFGTTSGPNTTSLWWTVSGTKVLVSFGDNIYEYNTSGTYVGVWTSTWAQSPDGLGGTLAYDPYIDTVFGINTTGGGGSGQLYSLSNLTGESAQIGIIGSFTSNSRQCAGLEVYQGEIYLTSYAAAEVQTEIYRTDGYSGPTANTGTMLSLTSLYETPIANTIRGLTFNSDGLIYMEQVTNAARLLPLNETVGIEASSGVGGASYFVRVK